MSAALLCWLLLCCQTYGVEPAFALAVARVESGTAAQEYRVGRLGTSPYYGPMGIHQCFLKRWPIDQPEENIKRGVRALRGSNTAAGKLRVLRRYNQSSNRTYERAVLAHYRRLKGELNAGSGAL